MEETEKATSSEEVTDSNDEETSASEPELMVTTRAKRTTAGNRYSAVVAQEEATEEVEDDDVALLFAEGDEEDEEYNSDEGADEADMSSSDDDAQGPTVGGEDLEGEKEIEKEAKADRAKKRKAEMALTNIAGLKKKPKIDPTSLRRAPAAKPSKRKERVSWLPQQGPTSTRPSLRAQTIAHRAETHAKLKVNEAQRLKMKAIRQQREQEREAEAPKELTQADRLAEAERIERKNAKSLNRWETMEKKRAEEQAAKLAALKDRKLNGAVVTWYSSSYKYQGLKDDREAQGEVVTELKKRGRKSKAFHEQMAAARLAENTPASGPIPQQSADMMLNSGQPSLSTTPILPTSTGVVPPQVTFIAPRGPDNFFLDGIHEYASMDAEKGGPVSTPTHTVSTTSAGQEDLVVGSASAADSSAIPSDSQPKFSVSSSGANDTTSTNAVPPLADTTSNSIVVSSQAQPESATAVTTGPLVFAGPAQGTSNPSTVDTTPLPTPRPQPTLTTALSGPRSNSAASPAPSTPLIEVISTRNLVILDKFIDLAGQVRDDFSLFFNNRKTTKPAKHTPELCLITGLPARYRDPSTGVGYANATAYKKLQQMKQHQFTWSDMLGCYVGRSTFVARGVPEGFLGS